MIKAIRNANVPCRCGKVAFTFDSPSALRFVCYSKDYRGYVQTLNEQYDKGHTTFLDPWGGVDLVQVYPSEITVNQGHEHLRVVKIRLDSPIRRVHASCCGTPLFDIGSLSALLYTQLLVSPNDDKPDVCFRIMGRHALLHGKNNNDNNNDDDDAKKPPYISWSLPWNWIFVMGRRIHKAKMEPNPIDISNPQVMENFRQG